MCVVSGDVSSAFTASKDVSERLCVRSSCFLHTITQLRPKMFISNAHSNTVIEAVPLAVLLIDVRLYTFLGCFFLGCEVVYF